MNVNAKIIRVIVCINQGERDLVCNNWNCFENNQED